MTIHQNRIIAWMFIGIIVLIGIFVAWPFIADDSFITFRYAKNLADGHGLVWNQFGDRPVEGYTNFLWMLLMVVPHWLGWSTVLFSKCLGLASFAGCGATLYYYGAKTTGRSMTGFLALLPLICLPSSYFHALSGLETMAYAFLLLVIYIIGLESLNTSKSGTSSGGVYVPPLVLLAGLIRPEGLLPGLAVLIMIFKLSDRFYRRRLFLSALVFLVLPGAVYFIWRYFYFGWLMPNTFYVKFGSLYNGLEWLAGTVATLAPILLLICLPFNGHIQSHSRPHQWRIYTGIFLALAILPYPVSGLTMNYMSRFLFHVLPVIFMAFALALDVLLTFSLIRCTQNKICLSYCVLLSLFLCYFPQFHNDKQEIAHIGMYGEHIRNSHIALARALSTTDIPPEIRTMTLGDAGAIPYYSDWNTFDFIGLNNEIIAHNPTAKTGYIAAMKPTIMILYSKDGRAPNPDQFGFHPQDMLTDYDEIAFIETFPDYYLAVYIRDDIDTLAHRLLSDAIMDVSSRSKMENASPDNSAGLINYLRQRLPHP